MGRATTKRPKIGDVAAALRRPVTGQPTDPVAVRRELLATWCKMALSTDVAPAPARTAGPSPIPIDGPAAPRARETLTHLLRGDSEKQIAMKLGISQHTVHVYVKRLYRHYGVSSRGELLARFVTAGQGPADPAN